MFIYYFNFYLFWSDLYSQKKVEFNKWHRLFLIFTLKSKFRFSLSLNTRCHDHRWSHETLIFCCGDRQQPEHLLNLNERSHDPPSGRYINRWDISLSLLKSIWDTKIIFIFTDRLFCCCHRRLIYNSYFVFRIRSDRAISSVLLFFQGFFYFYTRRIVLHSA